MHLEITALFLANSINQILEVASIELHIKIGVFVKSGNRTIPTNTFLEVAMFGGHCRGGWKLSRLYRKKPPIAKIQFCSDDQAKRSDQPALSVGLQASG